MFRRLLFLLLFAACTSSPSHWTIERTPSDHQGLAFHRLIYKPEDLFNGLELEIARWEKEEKAFLKIHQGKIRPLEGEKSLVKVQIAFSGQLIDGFAHLYEGGQKVVLHPDLQEALVSALRQEETVTLNVDGFHAILEGRDFSSQYLELQKP